METTLTCHPKHPGHHGWRLRPLREENLIRWSHILFDLLFISRQYPHPLNQFSQDEALYSFYCCASSCSACCGSANTNMGRRWIGWARSNCQESYNYRHRHNWLCYSKRRVSLTVCRLLFAGAVEPSNTPFSTTGGKGGTVTTVSTLAQFTAAANNAKNDDVTPRIIVISGTITGSVQVRIGSNKSIIGLPGASMWFNTDPEIALLTLW